MRSSLFHKFVAAVNEPVRFTRDSLDAIPALVEATRTAPPATRVHAARALLTMGKYTGRPALVRMLRTRDGSGSDRAGAALLLAGFPKPDKELLLEVASTDPDGSARSGALDALLTVVGLNRDEIMWGEVLLSISGRLLSSLTTVRNEAVAELRAILARWDAGETAEELGLTWSTDMRSKPLRRLIADIDSGRPDYRVEGLSDLTGRERTLVENIVLLRLHADRRAVRAAARLDVRRAVEPLRELLQSARGHPREEIQSALHTLTS